MKDGQIDAIIDIALAHAKQRAAEWLGEKAAETIDPELGASALGARALMWAIESQLGGQPGLYLWHGGELAGSDRCRADDPRLTEAVQAGPLLILIHGTGSHTLGALKDLRASTDWESLTRQFGERVFGFEHRTFSESPIDNALALAHTLPAGETVARHAFPRRAGRRLLVPRRAGRCGYRCLPARRAGRQGRAGVAEARAGEGSRRKSSGGKLGSE